MSEEETKETVEEAETPEVKQESPDLIAAANLAAERMEAGNKEMARLLAIQQQMQVEKTLGGQTTAGEKQETKEEKEIKNAKKYLEGTGMEDYAFPEKKT